MMIKVSDYIARRLTEAGVRHVFMITGGGAMHLNDSLGRHPDLEYICCHHEQACAIAAEGYVRASGRVAAVNVTTGPGGLNTLTGLMGSWTDSIPVLYLSGQVKFETTIHVCPDIPLRQLGDQEVDIIRIVQPLTKWAMSVTDPRDVRYAIEKALYLATHGRGGPVWLDFPMNVQGALVDESTLKAFSPGEDAISVGLNLSANVQKVVEFLQSAKRPIFVAGHGIRLAGAHSSFIALAERLGIPVVTTFNGFDLMASDHPLFIGRIGTIGTRAGNFALQNADMIISIGSRNNIRQVSYGWQTYGRTAKKVIVDIDLAELQKPTVRPDVAVQADAMAFIRELDGQIATALPNWSSWLEWGQLRKEKYPVVLPEYRKTSQIHPYIFVDMLTRLTRADDVVVAGNGSACVVLFQAGHVKAGQRIFWNSGCASMGYDLPAAIGACIGSGRRQTICLAGDGSVQMNIQELQTMAHHHLPIKLFILNNNGYQSIKQTQANFFGTPYIGCDVTSGISFPDPSLLAAAYGIPAKTLENPTTLEDDLKEILAADGPMICDVKLDPNYSFSPKLSSEKKPDGRMVSKPLEDMFPFLDRKEFLDNMLVEPWEPEKDRIQSS